MEADRSMHAAGWPAWDGGCCGLEDSGGDAGGREGGRGCLVYFRLAGWPFFLSLSHSFCLCLKIEFGAEEGGSTQLGFPYPLTQVMVLHTGDYGSQMLGLYAGPVPLARRAHPSPLFSISGQG